MTKYYEEDWKVPDALKHRITKISSNRKPDQEILLNAELFVTLFRDDLEKWLKEFRANNTSKDKPNKSKSKKNHEP